MSEPRLYVGTYAKYNNGSIQGEWLNLDDYSDPDAFYEACSALHADEDDPEFMFQDFEGFPKSLYSESGGIAEIYEYLDAVNNSHLSQEVFDAGIDLDIPLDKIEEAYEGEYKSDEDFAQELAESCGLLDKEDRWPYTCIDWEWAARELMFDYCECNGHYFSNNY